MTKADPRQGVVLVAVLWVIALLSALAMAASLNFRSFAGVVAIDRDRVAADAMLTAGLEASAAVVGGLGEAPLLERETSVSLSSGIVQIRLKDEGGLIDINKAPLKVLASLLRSAGADAAAADTIVQAIDGWRMTVGKSSQAINAAMSNNAPASLVSAPPAASMPAQGAPVAPQGPPAKDDGVRAFTNVRQLSLIPGMTAEYVAAIAPLTTVFGYEKINGLTAPSKVIAALPDLSEKQVSAFLDAREGPLTDDWLQHLLGPSSNYVMLKGRAIASVELTVNLIDGYSTKVKAVIAIIPGDTQPYRVLAWTPFAADRSSIE